jgi:hypothetical protein
MFSLYVSGLAKKDPRFIIQRLPNLVRKDLVFLFQLFDDLWYPNDFTNLHQVLPAIVQFYTLASSPCNRELSRRTFLVSPFLLAEDRRPLVFFPAVRIRCAGTT